MCLFAGYTQAPKTRGRGNHGRLCEGLQCNQQCLELFTTVAAALQVVLDQGHHLGRVFAGQYQFDEAIQLLESPEGKGQNRGYSTILP